MLKSLIMIILLSGFGTYLLFNMAEQNIIFHLFFSGISFGMALMIVPDFFQTEKQQTSRTNTQV